MKNITSLDEYQKLAKRTMRVDAQLGLILHCTMGMVGEAGELMSIDHGDPDNKGAYIGELGDCFWYVTNLLDAIGHELAVEVVNVRSNPNVVNPEEDLVQVMLTVAAELCDLVKKYVFYNQKVDEYRVYTLATAYLEALMGRVRESSLDTMDVLSRNIAKLEARYPDLRFEADKAINRDYEKESSVAGITIE